MTLPPPIVCDGCGYPIPWGRLRWTIEFDCGNHVAIVCDSCHLLHHLERGELDGCGHAEA